jgi:phosphate transport system substrate-binding protein
MVPAVIRRGMVWTVCALLATTGCGCVKTATPTAKTTISIDGSSTVYPISQAVAERYKASNPNIDISVGFAGTGGGFKKFVVNEIDICDASRPIKSQEKELCEKNGIEYLELQVAVDGLTVVINKQNDWCECLSVADLKKLWEPNSQVSKWSDLNPAWPDHKIELYGADTDSGTFEYFTEAIVGKSKESRTDYTPAANDNILVQGVAEEKYALGYFGFGYYVENTDRLKAVAIRAKDDGDCVAPSPESVDNGTYVPLARPLFIYVNKKALARPEVVAFLQMYLGEAGQKLVSERKFLPMKAEDQKAMQERLAAALAK